MIGSFQLLLIAVLAVGIVAFQVVALVDAVRRPQRAFAAEGKQTKQRWLLFLGIALVIGVLGLPPSYVTAPILNLISLAPAVIYWVDVRPAIKPYGTGNGPRRPRGPQW
ncbi:DUF2516 domain-containing protein [Xylanimonas oleitrophica]|uniref:DUF2516 domain-containing protein n=1 Tax=Xylanimonas oleitrophica TaxID=2607479 RepID=A0A2W5WKV1_9MICO|nr:DUF2516 domain-containing protein [Xylanimonas oleitrophica]